VLCCSLFAFLLSQFGAWAGAARLGASGGAVALAGRAVALWMAQHRLLIGGVMAAELALAAVALPGLYARDTAPGSWPICAIAAALHR